MAAAWGRGLCGRTFGARETVQRLERGNPMTMTGMTKAVSSVVVASALAFAPAAWAGQCKEIHREPD